VLDDERYADLCDERARQITVKHLLEHSGGWDRDQRMDPLWSLDTIARETGVGGALDGTMVIQYMLRHEPLDFAPGGRFCYSNLGYCILGRVIEQVTGEVYEDHVRRQVLAPLGIHGMRIGGDCPDARAPCEVTYYERVTGGALRFLVLGRRGREFTTQGCYGWNVAVHDANGGWIGTAADLLRFTMSFDLEYRDASSALLNDATVRTMLARPVHARDNAIYYGLGWEVEGRNYWHTGEMPGTYAVVARLDGGVCYAILFNGRPRLADFLADFARPMRSAILEDLGSGRRAHRPETSMRLRLCL
jgi:CubicO group peptidase (beta-lactamase class C family)